MPRPAPLRARRQRGVAALEMAVILPFFVVMLALPLYVGMYFYHYTMVHKAVQNAAYYLARVPAAEIANTTRAPIVTAVAQQMVTDMLADATPGSTPPWVLVTCGTALCNGAAKPANVTINVQMQFEDIVFHAQLPVLIEVSITLPYLGR